jgi:hypothetical protein
VEAIHKALTHPNAIIVPLTEKQFLWGLRYMHQRREKQVPTQKQLTQDEQYRVASPSLIDPIRLFFPIAMAAYEPTDAALDSRLSSDERTAMFKVQGKPDLSGSSLTPAHFVATVEGAPKKVCVVSIRGTESVIIAIKHTLAEPKVLKDTHYHAHGRMTEAANLLLGVLHPILEEYDKKGYRIVLTGHSLGGAAAAIVSILLDQQYSIKTEVYTFAAPPCVDNVLAEACAERITSVVGGDDLIPRLSAYSTAELSHQLATLEWGSIVKIDWWRHMTSAMPEGPCSDLVKELEMYSRSATSKGTLPAWLQDSNKDLIRLVPAGKIVLLMRTTTDILPLMMEYHDAPMQLQVSNTCVSDHQASEYSGPAPTRSLSHVAHTDLATPSLTPSDCI